jgi:hypothetical protein
LNYTKDQKLKKSVLIPSDTGRAGICLKRLGYGAELLIVLTITPLRYEGVEEGLEERRKKDEV